MGCRRGRPQDLSGTLFDYWAGRPKEQESFANCMTGYAGSMAPWTDIFPTEQLLEGDDPDLPLVVDVGGGVGHDLIHMYKKHGLGADLLVLQDQADVVAHAEPKGAFTAQAHNFIEAQPVQGARAYYLHSIMHDWPDEGCVVILGRTKDAMGPESRVLVHDIVLQAQDNSAIAAQSDVMMMVAFNSHERTEQMWDALVARVGLKIVQIHSSKASPQSVIELSLP